VGGVRARVQPSARERTVSDTPHPADQLKHKRITSSSSDSSESLLLDLSSSSESLLSESSSSSSIINAANPPPLAGGFFAAKFSFEPWREMGNYGSVYARRSMEGWMERQKDMM
jgi:hypothetical protein